MPLWGLDRGHDLAEFGSGRGKPCPYGGWIAGMILRAGASAPLSTVMGG